MFSVTRSLITSTHAATILTGLKKTWFWDKQQTKQTQREWRSVFKGGKSARWRFKCSSSSLFSSGVTGLCNYILIQSCTQSSYSLLLYSWVVKLVSAQTRKKINHINKVKSRSRSILCWVILFTLIFDFCWPLFKVKFFHAEVLRKRRFLPHLSFKES